MRLPLCLVLCAAFAVSAWGAESVPQWVTDAASAPAGAYPAKALCVVLFSEETLTVDADGRRVIRERGVWKVLHRGANLDTGRSYDTKDGRIRLIHGWFLPPDGKPRPLGKESVIDISLAGGATNYYDQRAKTLTGPRDAEAGSIFAYEIEEERKTVFAQSSFWFQSYAPVLVSRYVLTLPAGWTAQGTLINTAPQAPQVSVNTYTWELKNLPFIDYEDYRPPLASLAPRLAVSFFPPSEGQAGLRSIKDWASVSSWISEMAEPAVAVSPEIQAKADELTAGASTTLAKIQAIARYAQQVTYVSIQLDLLRGGGYTPHTAASVFEKNYGDCKDKATLTRALLKAAGIDSYYIIIYSGDRAHVRAEWPSPGQFNHAILAIRVPPDVSLPTVFEHPKLGRLLPFDPTDNRTPVGDLPETEQGSYALLAAGDQGELITMPLLPVESRRVECHVDAEVLPSGQLKAHVQRTYFGQSATYWRDVYADKGEEELQKRLESGFRYRLGGINLETVKPTDDFAAGRLNLDIEYSAEQFGRLMQGHLFVVKPGLLANSADYVFVSAERTLPIQLHARTQHDTVELKLPAGMRPDEVPEDIELTSPYGKYRAKFSAKPGLVTMEQWLEVKETLAPAADYAKIKDFFEQVSGEANAPAVFVQ